MKTILRTLAVMATILIPALSSATTWKIDPDHSNVAFKVRHLMVSNVKGTFDKFSGTVTVDDMDINNSRVEVSIDAGSINTSVHKRDEHLRSAEFLDVAKYPTITFVSRKVTRVGDNLQVTGDLTIHGVTKEVVLSVEDLSKESKDPWGNLRRGASATTKINRKDFGLNWNKTLETGGVVVGDDVKINLEVEMIKTK